MHRRTFLTSALALPLTGCGKKTAEKVLNVYIWPDYLPDAVVHDFAHEHACRVQVETFTSNEEMAAKAATGNSGFDVICPSPYMVSQLAAQGLLAKLDTAALPNMAHLASPFILFGSGVRDYAMPYQAGSTGIGYNRKLLPDPPRKWADLFDPAKLAAWRGRFSMLDDARETPAAALMALGHSINTADPAQIAAAGALLKTQKPFVASYDSETFEDQLAKGTVLFAQGYSGDFVEAMKGNPDLDYLLPDEGAALIVDCLAILKESTQQPLAHQFLNFIARPETAARIANATGYICVNAKGMDLVDPVLRSHPCWRVPPEGRRYQLNDPGTAAKDLYAKIWEELKQA